MKAIVISTLTVFLLASGVIGYKELGSQKKQNTSESIQADDIPYDKEPLLGNPNAPVKVVEFGDFKCPSCKIWSEKFFPKFKQDYIDSGKVSFYFINYPFIGPDSMTASLAAEAVFHQNNQSFWKFYHAIYLNQGDEKTYWATPEKLISLVKENDSEVNIKQLENDIANKTYLKEVENDYLIGKKEKVGKNGIPCIFINGKLVNNPFNYRYLQSMVEAEMKK